MCVHPTVTVAASYQSLKPFGICHCSPCALVSRSGKRKEGREGPTGHLPILLENLGSR